MASSVLDETVGDSDNLADCVLGYGSDLVGRRSKVHVRCRFTQLAHGWASSHCGDQRKFQAGERATHFDSPSFALVASVPGLRMGSSRRHVGWSLD